MRGHRVFVLLNGAAQFRLRFRIFLLLEQNVSIIEARNESIGRELERRSQRLGSFIEPVELQVLCAQLVEGEGEIGSDGNGLFQLLDGFPVIARLRRGESLQIQLARRRRNAGEFRVCHSQARAAGARFQLELDLEGEDLTATAAGNFVNPHGLVSDFVLRAGIDREVVSAFR